MYGVPMVLEVAPVINGGGSGQSASPPCPFRCWHVYRLLIAMNVAAPRPSRYYYYTVSNALPHLSALGHYYPRVVITLFSAFSVTTHAPANDLHLLDRVYPLNLSLGNRYRFLNHADITPPSLLCFFFQPTIPTT